MMTSRLASTPRLREARLRPEAAADHPWAPVGVWTPASTLADEARRNGAHGKHADPPEVRALSEEAFEFRGGAPEMTLSRRARTRWTDHLGSATGRRLLRRS